MLDDTDMMTEAYAIFFKKIGQLQDTQTMAQVLHSKHK